MTLALLEWISPSMLGWLAAATLPWWIHRWWLRRPRETPWAAMRLLREALRQRSRWRQNQQWLLLALRMLILLLVVLAAAGPMLRQSPRAADLGRLTHHVLLLDQSYSMGSRLHDEEGGTRFDEGRMLVRQVIESASVGDFFSVIGWAGEVENPLGGPTADPAAALAAVEQISVLPKPGHLAVALRAAIDAIRQSGQAEAGSASQRIYVMSDLGRNTWEDAASSEGVKGLCQELAVLGQLSVCPVGAHSSPRREESGSSRGNVAVVRISTDPPWAVVGAPLVIEATLRAWGSVRASVQQVELSIDSQSMARRDVELTAGQKGVVRFETRLLDPGPHMVRIACLPQDDLPLDDQRWRIVQARRQVRLLCLEGKGEGATDLVRALLSRPTVSQASKEMPSQAPYQVERIPASRLGEVNLSAYDAVLICNVAGFQLREAGRLLRFAQAGGAILFFLGDQVVPGQYASLLASKDQESPGALASRLPVTIGPAVEARDIHWDPLGYRHPLVAPFRDYPNSGLTRVTIAKYFKLAGPRPNSHDSGSTAAGAETQETPIELETALAFETGDPAILLGPLGLGRVVLVALPGSLAARTAAGTPWSSWPVNPSFLPLVRELMKQVVGRGWQSQFNRLVGEPLVLRTADLVGAVDLGTADLGTGAKTTADLGTGTETSERLLLETPGGRQVPVADWAGRHPGVTRLLLPTTRQCGIYSLRSEKSSEAERFRYAVNLDAVDPATGNGESDLATVTPALLPRSMAVMPMDSVRADAREISLGSYLFAAAFVLLLLELGLAWWVGKG